MDQTPYAPVRRRRGFTFVEVVFAIAVLSFALIGMLGLLSVGFSTQKSSAEDTRLAAMAHYVMATEHMKPFADVTGAGYTATYYFDLLGNTNIASTSYLSCVVTNITAVTPATGTNLVPMQAVFTYPLAAPAANRKKNVFYFDRAND